jgi:hypothetical protein
MSVDPGVLDANVLVYAVEGSALQHTRARALIEAARDPATALYLTSQAAPQEVIGVDQVGLLVQSADFSVAAGATVAIK